MSSQQPTREVAVRCFATEFNDATYSFTDSDDDMSPNYTLLPTGKRANRVFIAGTLTRAEDTSSSSDGSYWRGRVTDTTGEFFVYAGEYQPDARQTLETIDTPAYVAVVGKPRTWESNNGSTNVAIRPEEVILTDSVTRNEWVRETAELTLDRIDTFREGGSEDGQKARQEYTLDPERYIEDIVQALHSATPHTDDSSEGTETASTEA